MAAPTKPAGVKKSLANPEPSTHGPLLKYLKLLRISAFWRGPEVLGGGLICRE